MKTTRKTAAVALAAVALLGLTACSSDGDAETDTSTDATVDATAAPTEEDIAALDSIEWVDGEDGVPTLEFEAPLMVSTTVSRVVTEGDGETIEDGDYVSLNYVGYAGDTGEESYGTYSAGAPQSYQITEAAVAPVLYDALIGQTVGSQIILGESFEVTNEETGEPETTSGFTAVTVEAIEEVLDRAEGTAVDPVEGLPVVTLDDDGKPSVEIPDADAPTELVSQPLIEGEGAVVEADDTLIVNYSGWLWSNGEQFDSSWERGTPAEFGLTQVIEGWTEGLAGQTVGSQVLLVVPPEMGYGDQDSESIPAGSTLVFVVDILAAK
ncbi:FKBP-type peptidyl-prolyl cis-trans isomerase [Demequina sediminicola]|uniref:FKBP-type peptidyl-prolyl cis-trans isomerase n=1 Tax=Demequina sediminicola TaxID=1095026 RepID=UPI000781FF7F|nr:FKBP-type peptidyl-prolyl cis-trans isomerase [Demequina sediminicola]